MFWNRRSLDHKMIEGFKMMLFLVCLHEQTDRQTDLRSGIHISPKGYSLQ